MVKTAHISTMSPVPNPSPSLWSILRGTLIVLGWGLFTSLLVFTGYILGWVVMTAIVLQSGPAGDVPPILSVLLVLTGILAWLVARFLASWRSVLRVMAIVLGTQIVIGTVLTLSWPDGAVYLARIVAWGESGVLDAERFPARVVNNAAPAYSYGQRLSPELFGMVEYQSEGNDRQAEFEEFLRSTQTTSFLIIKDDAILYEGYFNGFSRDSVVTSFSIAKSFTSALVGIAIDESYIGSVDDRMIDYLPEMKGRGFDELTIRHLLNMSTGIRHLPDEEPSLWGELTQFRDGKLAYYYPDLRSLALQVKPDGEQPGARFNYNKYHPLLLGMILERTTGMPVAQYFEAKLWRPLGMEYPATWSLDSERSGFEKMESGINARAIDFAKFGSLFLHQGNWRGKQIIPADWVFESTAPDPGDNRPWRSYPEWKDANGYYKYMWWGKLNDDGTYDYAAQGHLGQWIYVSPHENTVIVRFGLDDGGVDSWADVFRSLVEKTKQPVSASPGTSPGLLPTSVPEEQGLDSAKLAEGLLAIKERGTPIHSLMIVRNDSVILDAYFSPYDGSIYHDLASVTKSVTTTLIGIAIDQGKLKLDDPMVMFFLDREIDNLDEQKRQITVRHLASMSSGLECDPITDEITLLDMRASEDWVQFALDRPVVREPGTRFAYCGLDMHLLSAILQKATGMSALDFAQLYLFEPLGIQDVYWPADPQGVTHGWGDLALHPRDMAKLGSLFLHQGKWGEHQIVSHWWVEQATMRHMSGTKKIEEYGYGWWVSPENAELAYLLATGNGGQKIRVVPSLNIVLVTTGAGFEPSEVDPYILAAIGDLENPLPANPAGSARLNAALLAVASGPQPEPVAPQAAVARSISGQTFFFEANHLGLVSLRLEFEGPASTDAIMHVEMKGEPCPRVIGIGLDGVYRSSHAGRPILARGRWTDAETFVIDYNEGPGLAAYTLRLHFDRETLILDAPGLGRFEAKKK
jgi:CubicO group peptidase (beta-lactamase class C family)